MQITPVIVSISSFAIFHFTSRLKIIESSQIVLVISRIEYKCIRSQDNIA